MPSFEVNDRRHSARQAPQDWKSPADPNLRAMREKGFVLPTSGTMARIEAKKMVTDVRSRGTATDVANKAMMASMRGAHGNQRTAANTQMVLPKVRQPLASLMDKGIPFNTEDPDELRELRRWCNTPDAPVWMADYTFKPIDEIKPGDKVIGWETNRNVWGSGRRQLTPTTVLAVNRRMAPEVVKITFASGRTVKCTPDHEWLRYYVPGPDGRILNGPEKSLTKTHGSEYASLRVGSIARSVIEPTVPLTDPEKVAAANWLAGIFDGEGSWSKSTLRIVQSQKHSPHVVDRIDKALETLGVTHRRRVVERDDPARGSDHHGGQMVVWDINRGGRQTGKAKKNRQQLVDFYNWGRPAKFDQQHLDEALLTKNFGEPEEVVSIESLGPSEVVSMQTTTGNYTAWGMASKNCRLFYATHPLVPLLVDIYSKFPVMGMEFVCLAAETPVITAEGVREIKDLAGGVHRVLTTGGKWVEAPFKSFGEQKLMKVTVRRNGRDREFFATPEHRWFVGVGRKEVSTKELKPKMRLVPSYGRNLVHFTNPSPFGIAHGITFGDGTRNTSGGGCHVDLYGKKDAHLLKYFSGCTTYTYGPRQFGAVPAVRVTELPRYFKDRPALTKSTSYLYGWLAGYFAADGTVSKKGEAFIDSARRSDIEYARTVCQLLGIHTSDPYVIDIPDTPLPDGGRTGPRTTYRLRLANESLTERFFCVPQHRERWLPYAGRKSLEVWRVVSVEETDRFEEVYCAVVPGTEAFTLDGNILTGNCKNPEVEEFCNELFFNELNYEEFLPDGLLREYFMVGEVTALAHFNESLGTWSSEEILNPDMVRVSKSLFVEQERVQLLVKELVESLRNGPGGMASSDESPSERFERTWEYCLTPGHRVLTADLRWVPVESLVVGDPIMGFDEHPRPGKARKRQWVPTRVEATRVITGNTYRIKTDGPTAECTDQHRWLAIPQNKWTTVSIDTTRDEEFYPSYEWRGRQLKRIKPWVRRPCQQCGIPMELRPSAAAVTKFCSKACANIVLNRSYSSGKFSGTLMWLRADEVRPGDKIMFLGQWDMDNSRDAAWMGGFLDGEGSLGKTGITFSQNRGPVLDRALEILDSYKFAYTTREGAPHKSSGKTCVAVRIQGGWPEVMRALSIFRPVRLLRAFPEKIHGTNISGSWVTVTEVTHVGEQDVIALGTSSKTLIAEGMFSHNTQLVKHYPEIIKAAAQDDGLDVSDALVSRLVNKAAWWDLRGTPHLLRSFRTLMLEESLNAAQDAVCQIFNTPVLTNNGVCYIQDVRAGDEVLTHRGRYQKVIRPMVREADEPGVTIRWWYDQPLTLTGEHPVYVRRKMVHRGVCAVCRTPIRDSHRGARRTVCNDHLASRKKGSGRLQRAVCCICGGNANAPKSNHCDQHDPDKQVWIEGFVSAKDVSVYDQVLHPSSPGEEKVVLFISDHISLDAYEKDLTGHLVERNGYRIQPFPSEVKLTNDLLWLIGLYVADGSANGKGIRITLGEKEQHLADRACRVLKESFGVHATVRSCGRRSDGSVIRAMNVHAYNTTLGLFFRAMCGVGKTKQFPAWAFSLSPEQTSHLIDGWMNGDGHTNNIRTLGTTAYRCLQESAAWLMRRSGSITSTFSTKRQGGYSSESGSLYSVTTVKTPRRAYPADQGGYWVDVRSVEHHQITETVYNLEVEEDNSYCVPIAVHNCDRLYAPMILATLGIENMGDGEPWIPDQGELEDLRDDIQSALAADFKLLCHNMGLQVTSVFGRESVPRFDTDYDRVDAQLMQAWGIGQGLIMGGTGSGGTYAGTAINREVCEQLMKAAQNKVIRHMKKRMEVVFEAQEFYDFELKGGERVPIYESIVEEDPESGDQRVVEVPKLIDCDIKFATLNLRDESTERAFVAQLKELGVPISDKTLAINIPFEFREELERQAQETVDKGMAQAEAYFVMQELCDEQGYPYPEDLAQFLEATLQLRSMKAQTEMAEAQNEQMEQQIAQASPAGMMGLLPGTTMQPLAPEKGDGDGSKGGAEDGSGLGPGQGAPMAAPTAGGDVMGGGDMSGTPYGAMTARRRRATQHGPATTGPEAWPPGGEVDKPMDTAIKPQLNTIPQRPEESDEMRGAMPKRVVGRRKRFNTSMPGRGEGPDAQEQQREAHVRQVARQLKRFGEGPSTFRKSYLAEPGQIKRVVDKRAAGRDPSVYDLVHSPEFYATCHGQAYESQIVADWPEIQAGGAPESRKLLDEMLEIYENATGVKPRGYL